MLLLALHYQVRQYAEHIVGLMIQCDRGDFLETSPALSIMPHRAPGAKRAA